MTPPATADPSAFDPKRPWIDDPRDLPRQMNWAASLLNPLGRTSRLHFTRAWTILFFARVFALVIPTGIVAVIGAGGGDASSAGVLYMLFPLTVVLTLFMSWFLHIRRLSDAGRSPLWATLVFLPVGLGLALAILFGQGAIAQHDAIQKDRAAIARGEEPAGARAGTRRVRSGQARRGGPRGKPPSLSQKVQGAATSGFVMGWAAGGIAVTIWSLTWPGRLPTGGGRIRDRFRQEQAAYEAG